MVSLDDLPTEILKQIFEYLLNHSSLVKTNRRCNAIATPLYYRDVFLYTDAKDEKQANAMSPKFFRTVRNNPTIAHSVRRICISGSRPDTYKVKFTVDEIGDEQEMRDAGIEDDWLFDELPRPTYASKREKADHTATRPRYCHCRDTCQTEKSRGSELGSRDLDKIVGSPHAL